jgi:hypothetical protein
MLRMFKARQEMKNLLECYPVCCEYLDDNWKLFISTATEDMVSMHYSWESLLKMLEDTAKMSSPFINDAGCDKHYIDRWNKTIETLFFKLGKKIKPYIIPYF